ncbi:MAG: dUTP diphosphatase [Clostridia bacterium]|nr:dUTP diphosphatase [Clostridia bacterium]
MDKFKIMLDDGAYMPERAHDADAGLDLKAMSNGIVPAGGALTMDTGVHVQIPSGYAGLLVSKSGLNCHHWITSTGLIDSGYTGAIKVTLHNSGRVPYSVIRGDKISQLVIIPVLIGELETVDHLPESERGNHGFGSTGRA